jgi:hypothetical protein
LKTKQKTQTQLKNIVHSDMLKPIYQKKGTNCFFVKKKTFSKAKNFILKDVLFFSGNWKHLPKLA